jgi:hypothetical protein
MPDLRHGVRHDTSVTVEDWSMRTLAQEDEQDNPSNAKSLAEMVKGSTRGTEFMDQSGRGISLWIFREQPRSEDREKVINRR